MITCKWSLFFRINALFYSIKINNKVTQVGMQLIDDKLQSVGLSIKASRKRVLTSIYIK